MSLLLLIAHRKRIKQEFYSSDPFWSSIGMGFFLGYIWLWVFFKGQHYNTPLCSVGFSFSTRFPVWKFSMEEKGPLNIMMYTWKWTSFPLVKINFWQWRCENVFAYLQLLVRMHRVHLPFDFKFCIWDSGPIMWIQIHAIVFVVSEFKLSQNSEWNDRCKTPHLTSWKLTNMILLRSSGFM